MSGNFTASCDVNHNALTLFFYRVVHDARREHGRVELLNGRRHPRDVADIALSQRFRTSGGYDGLRDYSLGI